FANFMAAGVIESALDGRQFVRQENESLIIEQKASQRRQIVDERDLHRRRDVAERYKSVGGAELLHERMIVTQPFGRFARRRLKLLPHVSVRRIVKKRCSPSELRCTGCAMIASRKSFGDKIKSLNPPVPCG